MNQDVYINDTPVLFWPDLASCHYAKKTLAWYEANDVPYVPKIANPPNCPELRPIETFWALCKRNLKKMNKPAKDIKSFKIKWNVASKKVTEPVANCCCLSEISKELESEILKIGRVLLQRWAACSLLLKQEVWRNYPVLYEHF